MTTDTNKLVEMALSDACEKGWCAAAQWANRDDLRHDTDSVAYAGQRDAILSGKAGELIASLCADVKPVAIYHGRCVIDCGEHGHLDMQLLKLIPAGTALVPASVVASLTAQRDKALARVAELEKDAARYRWLRSVPNAFKAQRIVNDTPHGMDATIDAAMNGGNQ